MTHGIQNRNHAELVGGDPKLYQYVFVRPLVHNAGIGDLYEVSASGHTKHDVSQPSKR